MLVSIDDCDYASGALPGNVKTLFVTQPITLPLLPTIVKIHTLHHGRTTVGRVDTMYLSCGLFARQTLSTIPSQVIDNQLEISKTPTSQSSPF